MSETANAKLAGVCGGYGCNFRDSSLLHQVLHRGIFCRLCSSCVLKFNPGSFCSICFAIIDAGSPAIVRCVKCPAICHRFCLSNPNLAFVCSSCKNPEGMRRLTGVESKKVLLVAARLSANSMNKAAVMARAEADRKVEEAAKARKRAREMLKRARFVCKMEKDKYVAAAAEKPKRKFGEQKRAGSREIEKWMRVHEPIPMMMGQVKEGVELKGGVKMEVKSGVPCSLGAG